MGIEFGSESRGAVDRVEVVTTDCNDGCRKREDSEDGAKKPVDCVGLENWDKGGRQCRDRGRCERRCAMGVVTWMGDGNRSGKRERLEWKTWNGQHSN